MDSICRRVAIRTVVIIITVLAILLLLGTSGAVPTEDWNKTYDGTAVSVLQTSDGGYIVLGSVPESYSFSWDAELVKIDANGNLQWNHTYGGSREDIPTSFQQTSDGGYIIAGHTYSYGDGGLDAWLIKTDANGNEMWNRAFGGKDAEYAFSVQQTKDEDYIIAGKTHSYGEGSDAWFLKIDTKGNEVWNRSFKTGINPNIANSVKLTADGGYIFTGNSLYYSWLIKTDANGMEQWNKTVKSDGSTVQPTSDGGYILAGIIGVFSSQGADAWLSKIDANGNELWNRTFGGTQYDAVGSVQQTSDGGYILAGSTASYGAGGSDAWLIKTDANGNEMWNRTFGDENDEVFRSVQQTSDGGYILAGGTEGVRTPTRATNFWLVKVGTKEAVIIPTVEQPSGIWTWGNNQYGQLGDGTQHDRLTPVQVRGISGVIAIASGAYHTVALKSDGTVWTWGANFQGELGDGTQNGRLRPVQVEGLSSVTAIAGGERHTIALKSDRTVWTWGGNQVNGVVDGRLGDGTTNDSKTPVQVSKLSDIIAVAGGDHHTIALKSDGTVWTWGGNYVGELGDGTMNNRLTPVQVSSLSGVIAIAAGWYHTVALKSDRTVWTWGDNSEGRLGDGTTYTILTPVQVRKLSDIIAIASGAKHTIALKSDGTVWTWGNNQYGQLGDGTINNRFTPVQVSGLSGVIAIAGGVEHTIALKSDGTVWTWGSNWAGDLGDGTINNRLTPVQVSGLSGVIAIAGGSFHNIALKLGSISGYKINDVNGNGIWDSGEKGVENWNIKLLNGTSSASTPIPMTITYGVSNLGQPVKDKSNVWALTTGIDGNIYGGTGEGGTLFIYDPINNIYEVLGGVSGEDAVYSLATDEKGLIYGGTAWNSKFFVYDPINKSITYLGQPIENGGIICSLAIKVNDIYGSTSDGGDRRYVDSHFFIYNSTTGIFVDLGQPVAGEMASKITLGKDGNIYGGTSPNGYLFTYDPESNIFTIIGQPVQGEGIASILTGNDGKIYFSLSGSLYVFDPATSNIDNLFELGKFIPVSGELNNFGSMTEGLDGNIYGGTVPNGYLFVFNKSDNSIATGKPLESEDRIRSLTTGLDGKIYGGTGWGAYLFFYNPYTAQVAESDIYYYPAQTSWTPWNMILPAVIIIFLAVFFLLIRRKRESKKEESIAKLQINNFTDQKIKLWVYLLFFLGGILSLLIGGGILIIILSSGILNQYAFFSSGLGFYLQFSIFLLPVFTCSIFFAIGMYFFKSKLYTYTIKAFVASFVASSFILITGVITGLILPFILPLLIFAVIWLVSGRNPDMKFPLKAFISTFLIPILINIAGIFYLLLIFGVNSRLFF